MGSGFTASEGPPSSTPPAPRETWAQRMSRREHRRRDRATRATVPTFGFAKRDPKARAPRPQQRAGEQEEVDQLTAFRTGAFDGLDSRNGAAP